MTDQILHNYKLVTNYQDVPAIAQVIDRVPKFALDLETTGLDFNRSQVHGVSLATQDQEWYVCLGAEEAVYDCLPGLVKDKTVIGHNLPFDMHFLHKRNIWLPKIIDTLPGQFMVDENQKLGLKDLANRKFGYDLPDFGDLLREAKKMTGKKKLADVTIYDMPLEKVAEYGAKDTRINYDLAELTLHELEREGLLQYFFDIEMPFTHILTEMEETGFYLDQSKMSQAKVEFIEKRDHALTQWVEITGGVNPGSHDQLAEYFYKKLGYKTDRKTDSGAQSTDIIAITRLKENDKNGAVSALLEYRKYEKLLGTYITSFEEMMFNGILYGSFYPGPVTGRLASSDPNLQNIPAHGETGEIVREFFASQPGYLFLDCDYSQLELRIYAHYTKDPGMMKAFLEGLDPHQMTADMINALGYAIKRKDAKAVNFGKIYGIGARKLQDSIEKSTGVRPTFTDAKNWLAGYSQIYPVAAEWNKQVVRYARELGYVKTIAGRKRRLPELRSYDEQLRMEAERQAVNSIIQGSAADIIKWAMVQIHPFHPQYDARIMAQVHDELCHRVPEAPAKEFAYDVVKPWMERSGEQYNLRLPLEVSPGIGRNWAEAKH